MFTGRRKSKAWKISIDVQLDVAVIRMPAGRRSPSRDGLRAAHCVDPSKRETVGLFPIVYCGICDLENKVDTNKVSDSTLLSRKVSHTEAICHVGGV